MRYPIVAAGLALALNGAATQRLLAVDPDPSAKLASVLPARLRFQLASARVLAEQRLERHPECAALFAGLERDGEQVLRAAGFFVASAAEESATCIGAEAALFTTVGGSDIGICPQAFSRMTRTEAAAALLHEGLHHAGMGEQPYDPAALSSREITQLVRRQCGL